MVVGGLGAGRLTHSCMGDCGLGSERGLVGIAAGWGCLPAEGGSNVDALFDELWVVVQSDWTGWSSSIVVDGEVFRGWCLDACAGKSAVLGEDDDAVGAGDVAFHEVLFASMDELIVKIEGCRSKIYLVYHIRNQTLHLILLQPSPFHVHLHPLPCHIMTLPHPHSGPELIDLDPRPPLPLFVFPSSQEDLPEQVSEADIAAAL